MNPEEIEAEVEIMAAAAETYEALSAWAAKWKSDGGTREDFVARVKRNLDEFPWSSEETRREVVRRHEISLVMVWPEGEA